MPGLSSLSLCRWSPGAFVLMAIAACGNRAGGVGDKGSTSATSGGVSAGTVSGTSSGLSSGASAGNPGSGEASGTNPGTGQASGTNPGTGQASGTNPGTGQASGAASGAGSGTCPMSGTVSASSTSSGSGSTASDASSESSGSNSLTMKPSAGCGAAPWTGLTGQWVSQPTGCARGNNNQGTAACQPIPSGCLVPATATEGSPEYRGWWVYVPTGYNPNKPYRVIYNGAGCDDPDLFHAGADGYPYESVDGGNAILVGLDYDTFASPSLGCYDSAAKTSNDFRFFPWLQSQIESQFCVDTNQEFFSGYGRGAWLAQQLNCAFPDKLRGGLAVTGCEPGGPADPFNAGGQDSQPTCVSKPTAMLYVKDIDDPDDPYACMIPGCARVLAQNGCTNTKCDPTDPTLTTPYPAASVPGVNLQVANGTCVQFNGCPAEYPVVWCTTNYAPSHHSDDEYLGVVPLFWDFMNRL